MSPSPDRSARWTGASPALSGNRRAVGWRNTQAAVLMLDLVLVVVAGTAAYLARFEGRIPPTFFRQLAVVIPVLALARVAANRLFGVYRMVWRYVGLVEALRFAQACAAVSALLLFGRLFLGQLNGQLQAGRATERYGGLDGGALALDRALAGPGRQRRSGAGLGPADAGGGG